MIDCGLEFMLCPAKDIRPHVNSRTASVEGPYADLKGQCTT